MAGILIYSDKSKLAKELLTAANEIAQATELGIKALVVNNNEQAEELVARGAQVYSLTNEAINIFDTASVASAVSQAAEILDTHIILLASDRRGKELAGRVAQLTDAGCLSDVLGLQVNDTGDIECVRNALGGGTIAVQTIETENKVIAISPKSFETAEEKQEGTVTDIQVEVKETAVKLIERRPKAGDTVDIEAAEVIVAVGQGAAKEDLELIEKIAKYLGGEVACSKPVATDRKWFSEDRLIGLSGKKCKPKLAILMGISGQVQFMVGIREAQTIVAVNTDEGANIMQMADYKLEADIKKVLPELARILKIV